MQFKTIRSAIRVAIGFSISHNILKVELRVLLLSECNKKAGK